MNANPKCPPRRRVIPIALTAVLVILALIAFDSRLLVRRYTVDAQEIGSAVRIALVTDLHSCYYGEGQSALIGALDSEKPDLVLLGGDIFDDVIADTNTAQFLAGIADRYPCYYVTGNHEYWSGAVNCARKMQILTDNGISVLSDTGTLLTVRGEMLYLCGMNDPDVYHIRYDKHSEAEAFLSAQMQSSQVFSQTLTTLSESVPDGIYSVLLSHRPEYFDLYRSTAFDLTLCGHAHGGQWRIPGLINGVYAPHQGILPAYAGGRYEENGTTMIVSRGLAQETTWVPRIFNRPELVIIDLQ